MLGPDEFLRVRDAAVRSIVPTDANSAVMVDLYGESASLFYDSEGRFQSYIGQPPEGVAVVSHVALEDFLDGVPAAVEQLCEWMTRKDPGNRPESHTALLEVVDGLLDAGLAAASMPEISATDLPYATDESMGTPVTPIFVGRTRELGKLDGPLGEALGGCGRVVLVTGEAGSG